MRLMKSSLRILALVGAVALAATAAFSLRYPGFMRAGLDYTLHTSLHERMNASFMLLYWLQWVGR